MAATTMVCDTAGNYMLDNELSGVAVPWPSSWLVCLSLAPASRSGHNRNANGQSAEVSGGSYARVTYANNTTNFPATSGRTKSNGTAIVFPVATATWGLIESVFLMDAATGLLWRHNDLPAPIQVNAGDPAFTLAIGALAFGRV
jgi:hypothetical protein